MSKRRHEGDEAPSKVQRGAAEGDLTRKSILKAYIIGLNSQFASWINCQNNKCVEELWTDGVRDYLKHVENLLEDFKDVISSEKAQGGASSAQLQAAAAATKAAFGFTNPLFHESGGPSTESAAPKLGFLFQNSAPSEQADKPSAAFGFSNPPASTAAGTEPAASKEAQAPKQLAFSFGAAATSVGADKGDAAPVKKVAFTFAADTSQSAAAGGDANSLSSSKPASTSFPAFAATPSSTFAFGASSQPATGAGTGAAPSLFGFGGSTTMPAAAHGSAPAASSLFSFGAPAAGASAASAPAATSSLFSFGAPATFGGAGATAAATAAEEAEEAEEAPQKFESEVAVNEDAGSVLFKAKSKFSHLRKDSDSGKSTWENKGIGTLMLRTTNDDSKKPFVTFTTEAGRVLYIANVPKAMQVMVNNEASTVTFSAPWSPDGQAPPTPQGVLFKLPKGKHVDFKAEVDKVQATL